MFDVMYGYEKATDHFKKAIAFFMERGGFAPSFINISKVYIKGSSISDSKQDIKWSRLFEYYEKIKVKKILLDMNDRYLSDAEGWVQKAIETDKRNKARWFLARDYALYAELFMRKGDQSRAKENLAKAIDIFKECGADGWVEKSEKEIDEFS
jgi:tetratricopeptide (TPR) repeat protein